MSAQQTRQAVLTPGRKLIVELHIEFEQDDRPTKLTVATLEDQELWLKVLGEVIARGKKD